MARCNCGSSAGCSCRLVAGDGITMTGSGALLDPFIITADNTSFANSFQAVDTDSVNLDLTGSGTEVDPFVLRATSAIAMEQLSNWDDPSGPAIGEVPVWNGAAWEAASPPTQAPGEVNTAGGILGDGTFADPIRVAVSDDVSTTLSGLAIYIDTAGELRAVPPSAISLSWDAITDKPSTFASTWTLVGGKPTTFPPNIGTTSGTAWAGNRMPTWSEVTGKPPIVSKNPSSTGNAVTDVTGTNLMGLRWNGARVTARVDTTDFQLAHLDDVTAANASISALGGGALVAKANAHLALDAVRYTYGPSAGTYARTVAGAGFYAVWMDNGLEFGRNVSARKYKKNIAPYPVAPADVLALTPVKYLLKSSPDAGEQYGLIADDVAVTLPEIVSFEDGEPETIRYDLLSVALLDVVKDHQASIESLERKHTAALARIRTLEGSA